MFHIHCIQTLVANGKREYNAVILANRLFFVHDTVTKVKEKIINAKYRLDGPNLTVVIKHSNNLSNLTIFRQHI